MENGQRQHLTSATPHKTAVGVVHVRLFAAVCLMVMTVSCSSSTNKTEAPVSSETPPKPELSQVTTSMFVDRSAVPNSPATEYTAPSVNDVAPEPNDPVEPPECGPIFWGPTATQAGAVTWSTTSTPDTSPTEELKVFNLFLVVPRERPDLESLLGKCGTIKYQGLTTTASPLRLPGVPSWATATRITTPGADGAGIIGLCRGLYISVAFTQKPGGDLSPSDTDALVKLFNDQVAKLEAI
jgi:hypothetical protein